MIILDTDAISFLEGRKAESPVSVQLRLRLRTLSADHQIVTTVISYEEQTRGWFKKLARAKEATEYVQAYDKLLEHLQNYREIEVIPYALAAHSKLLELKRLKLRVGTCDEKIAAIALTRDATLFTRNLSDFSHVPGLKVQDWMTPDN